MKLVSLSLVRRVVGPSSGSSWLYYYMPGTTTKTVNAVSSSGVVVTLRLRLVGCNPTFAKNGRLGVSPIPGFVLLQKYCSPIRLQYFKWNIHTQLKFMASQHITIITIT